jgi:hypothetical protein
MVRNNLAIQQFNNAVETNNFACFAVKKQFNNESTHLDGEVI